MTDLTCFHQGDVFMWIEVLSAVGTPRMKDFTTRVADAWLAIRLKVGHRLLKSKQDLIYACIDPNNVRIVRNYFDRAAVFYRTAHQD